MKFREIFQRKLKAEYFLWSLLYEKGWKFDAWGNCQIDEIKIETTFKGFVGLFPKVSIFNIDPENSTKNVYF
jgi:hypothetical protein